MRPACPTRAPRCGSRTSASPGWPSGSTSAGTRLPARPAAAAACASAPRARACARPRPQLQRPGSVVAYGCHTGVHRSLSHMAPAQCAAFGRMRALCSSSSCGCFTQGLDAEEAPINKRGLSCTVSACTVPNHPCLHCHCVLAAWWACSQGRPRGACSTARPHLCELLNAGVRTPSFTSNCSRTCVARGSVMRMSRTQRLWCRHQRRSTQQEAMPGRGAGGWGAPCQHYGPARGRVNNCAAAPPVSLFRPPRLS